LLDSAFFLQDFNWKVVSTFDLNGDDKADLLWYNSATGGTVAWTMDGLSRSVTNSGTILTNINRRSVNITAAPLIITSGASLPAGTVGVPYSRTLAAVGGTPSYSSWTKTAGTLPPNISLNVLTGTLNGTPAGSPGTFNFTVTVQDALGQTTSSSFQLVIQ
jgi:hypothetical protein